MGDDNLAEEGTVIEVVRCIEGMFEREYRVFGELTKGARRRSAMQCCKESSHGAARLPTGRVRTPSPGSLDRLHAGDPLPIAPDRLVSMRRVQLEASLEAAWRGAKSHSSFQPRCQSVHFPKARCA